MKKAPIKFTITDPKALHAAQPTLVEIKHVPAHDEYIPDQASIRAALKLGMILPGVKVEVPAPPSDVVGKPGEVPVAAAVTASLTDADEDRIKDMPEFMVKNAKLAGI